MTLSTRRATYRESLRQEILDAARELFIRLGYEATSVRAIAAKVGCSPGILYHYFEDKAAIMAQLVREAFHRLSDRMKRMTTDDAPPLDRLRRALRTYIEFGVEHPHHYSLLFGAPAAADAKIKQAFEIEGMSCFGCLQSLTASTIAAGVLRPELEDPAEIAQALWVSVHGMVSLLIGCDNFPFVERTRLIDRQVDVLIEGLRRR
jgi:AcrR family transcriptional regulator